MKMKSVIFGSTIFTLKEKMSSKTIIIKEDSKQFSLSLSEQGPVYNRFRDFGIHKFKTTRDFK